MRNGVSYLVYMYTLGAGRILIKSIMIVCLLDHLMAWKASWAHRTGENEKKDNDEIKKSWSKRRAPVISNELTCDFGYTYHVVFRQQ